ncbi:hypothetical protein E3N88_01452 [Mikania micrantha]|uniref:Uncharacterized protein n=1 Tax=Mikania micrantha TaxID=192012 RepID=A0A5N6Q2L5_9ASTR|nr:hypothetical protein E3N88_01452 [Mikania micrantha]
MLAMEEGRVMSTFDAVVIKEGTRDELLILANLAMRCLNLNGKYRPTMKEVSSELETIKRSHIPSMVQSNIDLATYAEELSMPTFGESSSTFLSFNESIDRVQINIWLMEQSSDRVQIEFLRLEQSLDRVLEDGADGQWLCGGGGRFKPNTPVGRARVAGGGDRWPPVVRAVSMRSPVGVSGSWLDMESEIWNLGFQKERGLKAKLHPGLYTLISSSLLLMFLHCPVTPVSSRK